MTRKYTCTLIDLVDQGVLSWETIARACLRYMSEDDVADMAHCEDLVTVEECEESDDDL